MRVRSCFSAIFCLLSTAVPGILLAQFQEPTPEELKLTSDSKAPGADAIYLYREETVDDLDHVHAYYERIKILAEKGRELATVHIPYKLGSVKILDIQGRTIHADGSIIPLTTKPDELMEVKTKDVQFNDIVLNLPSAEVGSILEYRLKLRPPDWMLSEPTWDVQRSRFVRKAHYFFRPQMSYTGYSNLSYAVRMGSDAKVVRDNKKLTYSLDVTDVPPLPDEDWMPPINTLKWRVVFYYTNFKSNEDFWKSEAKSWADMIQGFTNPTGTIKKAAETIVAPGDTQEQKARKLYGAVMKIDNTEFTRAKSKAELKAHKQKEIKKLEDVWKQQYGTADEIALMFVALARAAGLQAEPMRVVNRDRAIFDASYMSYEQLDDYIAVVTLDGKEIYLDPGEKMCPFGVMHWKHTLATGFKLSGKDAVIATTPSPSFKTASLTRAADIEIDEQGEVKGSARYVMTGPVALRWRQIALQNDPEEVKKEFNESMRRYLPEGVRADFDRFLALDESEANLIGIVKLDGNLGSMTGKRLFLPGLFFESNAKHPFVAVDKRLTPVDVQYPEMEVDDVTYHLPAGYQVESAPQNSTALWKDHAQLKIASSSKNGTVHVARALAYNYVVLGPADYSDLHDFYGKIATADQQQVVLVRSNAVKGN